MKYPKKFLKLVEEMGCSLDMESEQDIIIDAPKGHRFYANGGRCLVESHRGIKEYLPEAIKEITKDLILGGYLDEPGDIDERYES